MRQFKLTNLAAIVFGLLCLLSTSRLQAGGPQAERVLQTFLTSEHGGEMQLLGNCLETFNLEQLQIERLVAAARETTSEERRNLLWHALRQTRSTAARDFLNSHLVEDCDHTTRVRYLRSLTSLAPFDVPLLIALYQGAEKTGKESKVSPPPPGIVEDDVREVILQLATREATTLAETCPSWPEKLSIDKGELPYMTTSRRQKLAKQAQAQLLRWIALHAASEQHRLAAIPAAHKVLDSGEQALLSRELLAAVKTPEERVRLYPLLLQSWGVDLVPLLLRDDENETSKVGILQAMHEHGSSYGYSISSVRHGVPTYEFLIKNDPSPKVRAAAEVLLKRLRESPR